MSVALSLMALFAAAPPVAAPLAPPTPPERAQVQATMKGNLAALTALQPLLASPDAFRDPNNAATIQSSLSALTRVKHQFARPVAQEPAAAVAGLFAEVVERARLDFDGGRPDPARMRLRSLTTLCMGCHSRQLSLADFTAAGKVADGAGLQKLERAQFFAATRQFDAALALWADALARPRLTDADSFEQSHALRSALSVAVRAKDDPAAAVGLLEGQVKRADMPEHLVRVLQVQLEDARAWQAERLVVAKQTPRALLERARALVDASGAADTVLPRESARLKLLRATAYLSFALERDPKAAWRPEALYLLGVAAGASLDPDLWELDGLYLEACVREAPHTPVARRCVERLSERTLFDFTGSGGTRLPPDVAQKLETLRLLAK